MESGSIDRIKNATFSHAVRGYDRHEVDAFLRETAEWLERGGDEEAGSEAVRTRLERVGEQTAGILAEAHEAAEAIREDASAEVRQALIEANATSERVSSQADEYAQQTRAEADAYALKARSDADDYAAQAREEAETAAAQTREQADREAQRIVSEASRRRRDIEQVIGDLEQRREAVVEELDRLASGLAGTATEHRGSRDGSIAAPEPTQEVDADTSEGVEEAGADQADADQADADQDEDASGQANLQDAETQEHSVTGRTG